MQIARFSAATQFAVVACALLLSVSALAAQEKRKLNYQDDLVPLFRESCFGCHNPDKTKGGLNLATFTTLMQGGSSGTAIAAGDPGSSYLYQLVTHESEPHMPLNSAKLPDEKLAIIRRFIEDGALENSGSKAELVKKDHAELKIVGAANQKPDGPPPMPPRLQLEPVIHTSRPGAITALAASPWAPLVAVAGQQEILLYNLDNLQLIGVLPFLEGNVHVLKFSRSGKVLLAGGGQEAKSGRVVLWDVTTGKRITEIGDEYDVVLATDISPDQSLVALGGPGKIVRIFSTETGELVHQIKKHTDWIYSLAFSPDNVLLASGDRNGDVFVWEAAKGQEFQTLRGHTAGVTSLSWRIDGNVLASASDDGNIRLWEMEGGKQIKTWNAHGGVQWVDFCRDGRLVTCGRDRQVKLWNADGRQQGGNLGLTELAMRVAFTADGTRLVAGDWAGQVRVWNIADGKPVGELSANPPTLSDRLQAATAEVAARASEHERLASIAAASSEQSKKTAAALAAARKALDTATTSEKASQTEVAQLQQTVEQLSTDNSNLKTELTAQQSAAEALAESLAKVQQAAEKLPSDARLAEAVEKMKATADSLAADMAIAQKSLEEKAQSLAARQVSLKAARKSLETLSGEIATAREQIGAQTAAAKSAAEKAAADQQALDTAETPWKAAQAEVQRWTEEIEFAKSAPK